MRVGLAGAGRIGASHAGVLSGAPGVDALVVTDVDGARARDVADRLGAQVADSPEEMLRSGVDALVIATPTASHAELILAGVAAAVPVFCEKPVALDLAATLRVQAAVLERDAVVQIGFQRRFDAGYAAARTAVTDGLLGTVHRVHAITADPEPPAAQYIPNSGGIFRDCHIHDFDMIRWVTGQEVLAVTAIGANLGAAFFAESGDVDTSAALLELSGGALATLQGSRYNGGGYDVRMEVAGTAGTWAVGMDPRVPLRTSEGGLVGAPATWPNFWERFAPAYAAEMAAFLDLARGEGPNPCPVSEALAALRIAEAADASRRQGVRVAVAADPDYALR
jgi:myo-inositol 2-dehydrogenase/D-chiro-inositol 1-dehydrogenase